MALILNAWPYIYVRSYVPASLQSELQSPQYKKQHLNLKIRITINLWPQEGEISKNYNPGYTAHA